MNDDLISREALKKKIEEVQYTQEFCIEHQIDYSVSMQMLGMVIDNAPTVEPVLSNELNEKIETYKNAYRIMSDAYENEVGKNRLRGEWIDEGQYAEGHSEHFYRCSECGGHIIELRTDDFCKHCGADMRVKRRER